MANEQTPSIPAVFTGSPIVISDRVKAIKAEVKAKEQEKKK